MRTPSTRDAVFCAVGLAMGACILTALGGEAGGNHSLAWLATLAALTWVWIAAMRAKAVSPALLLGTALLVRLIFLWMPSGFDLYRYIWEGKILLEGFNPYLYPPNDPLLECFRDEIWPLVGHHKETAIYPPLTQWLFAAFSFLGFGVIGYKLIFMLADLAICLLLCRRFGAKSALIYAWNPLAAVSFAGGGHYDSLFMLAMVLAWFSHQPTARFSKRTAFWLGVSIAMKWMAAPLGLWLVIHQWKTHGLKRAAQTGACVAFPAIFAWSALSFCTGEWTLQLMPPTFSRDARSAELIPAIADFLLPSGQLHNRWFMAAMVLAWIAVALKCRTFQSAAEWGFFATFVLSPMLHAWYFIWALPFAVPSRHPGYIALAASGIFYFVVHITMEHNGGKWIVSGWERAAIWLPFLIGTWLAYRDDHARNPLSRER